jgi:hypothetical protein
LSQFNKPINRVIRPRLPNKRQIGKKKNDYETQFSINAIYVIEKKIDDKIKIKIIKIKFDIKNNLAVHFKKKKKDEWSSEPNQSSSTHKCCMWR